MLTGIVSGIIAGIIVSFVSVFWSLIRSPKFELRYASSNTVTLHHNRIRSVVIGGSYQFGNRSGLLCTTDNRAGTSGILIPGLSETNLWSTEPPVPIGGVIEISYKRAPLFPVRRKDKWHAVLGWSQEPYDIVFNPDRDFDGWKVAAVPLRHS